MTPYDKLLVNVANHLTNIKDMEESRNFLGALDELRAMRDYLNGFVESAETRLIQSAQAKASYDAITELVVVYKGKDYLISKEAYEKLHDLSPDVKAGKMTSEQATAIILWSQGLLSGEEYVSVTANLRENL